MPPLLRRIVISFIAYVFGVLGAVLAIVGLVDIKSLSLNSGLPTVAMTTPMIAVVGFWAVTRILGAPLNPMRVFLFGGIAIYSLLYACGRIVSVGLMSDGQATIAGAIALYAMAFLATQIYGAQRR
ncbi:MAG: hypothetical protein P8P56_09445 [Yoonia sp.]|nr:hypothetical protein [Yoonia sp.]